MSSDGKLNDDAKDDIGYRELEKEILDKTDDARRVLKIFRSQLQRNIMECLLSTGTCSTSEISGYTGVPESAVKLYKKSIFKIDTAFDSMIDFLDYIETGIDESRSCQETLNSFLLKRWASSLGVDFVLWKFKLIPVEYNISDMYDSIVKESFYYHKEKSMGNDDVQLSDYLKSTNILLNGVRSKEGLKASNEDTAVLDIEERLDIIIHDEFPPDSEPEGMDNTDFINNAIISAE